MLSDQTVSPQDYRESDFDKQHVQFDFEAEVTVSNQVFRVRDILTGEYNEPEFWVDRGIPSPLSEDATKEDKALMKALNTKKRDLRCSVRNARQTAKAKQQRREEKRRERRESQEMQKRKSAGGDEEAGEPGRKRNSAGGTGGAGGAGGA